MRDAIPRMGFRTPRVFSELRELLRENPGTLPELRVAFSLRAFFLKLGWSLAPRKNGLRSEERGMYTNRLLAAMVQVLLFQRGLQ